MNKELRAIKRLARQMVEIGCREFRGPIEMTTRLPAAKKLMLRIIKDLRCTP